MNSCCACLPIPGLKHNVSGYAEALEPTSLKLTAELDLFYYFHKGSDA